MMKGITFGLGSLAKGLKDAHEEVEAQAAPTVGHLHGMHGVEEERIAKLAVLTDGGTFLLWLHEELNVVRQVIENNSLYIAMFSMLLD